MVFFLNSKVKTHTADTLQYIFDENKEKKFNLRLQYSIEEISPGKHLQEKSSFTFNFCQKFTNPGMLRILQKTHPG